LPTYKSKADAEKQLKNARNRLVRARNKWKANKTPENKAAMDKVLAECVAIEDIINKHY
jgi:hypothetical protein